MGRVKTEKMRKRVLKPSNLYGYHRVGIIDVNGGQKLVAVHRLVAQAFIPNPDNKPEIDHINTQRDDNRVDNLRWVTHSENVRNEISTAKRKRLRGKEHFNYGRRASEETREKLRASHLGKKMSEETKAKISKAISGENHYLYGKHPSEEAIRKMVETKSKQPYIKTEKRKQYWERNRGKNCKCSKKIYQYTKDGEFVKEWESLSTVERVLGFGKRNISSCACGKRKSAYNYIWKYHEER